MIKRILVLLLLGCYVNCAIAATKAPVYGKDSMVVSAQHLASDIGDKILEQGGNAIDAAVAVGYALAVVHPCCGNIGGGGFMMIRLKNGKTTMINFREKAPLAATAALFSNNNSNPYLNIGVPGTVLGLNTALKKYGSLPLRTVMQPAIDIAKNGYTLQRGDIAFLQFAKTNKYKADSEKIFTKNRVIFSTGEKLVQKDLAKTLELIAKKGSRAFYHGAIAKKIVTASKNNNGLLSKKDFKKYSIQELQPIVCHYRDYTIYTAPPPSAGGITICEILNILEAYPLKSLGFHSAASTHYTVEAMRHAYADRASHLGDPDFVKNPTEELISKQHAKKIRKYILENAASDSKKIGPTINPSEHENTTAFVVVDKHRNAVAVTYTLNGFFGSRMIAGDTGFLLNNELDDFNLRPGKPNFFGLIQGKANIIEPGKRPLSSMAPTFITKNDKLFMAVSTPGGSTIPTQIVAVIQNVIDYGMNIQEAVDAPRFHMQWLPDVIFYEPFSFSTDTLQLLKKMGHKFKIGAPYGAKHWGAVTAFLVDQKTNEITGAIDSRRPAGAAVAD